MADEINDQLRQLEEFGILDYLSYEDNSNGQDDLSKNTYVVSVHSLVVRMTGYEAGCFISGANAVLKAMEGSSDG